MHVNADIYVERDDWRRPMVWSASFHGLLALSLVGYAWILGGWKADPWGAAGAGGGAMNVTLVSAAVPLPARENPTENIVANESPGLSRSVPQPKAEEPEAIEVPDRNTKVTATPKPRPPDKQPAKEPPKPDNTVPFGQGGPVRGPYTVFQTPNASGGISTGGGDFGAKYSWYVEVVRRKISENWMKYEIDPSIGAAKRVYITFDIYRDGAPKNVQVAQTSGVPSLDQSATRALQRIDTFGPLPPDYRGSRVSVEFWFDYKR
jgi:periplasmic protein TonB